MTEEQYKKADNSYQMAEQKALDYFEALEAQVTQGTYEPVLLKDLQLWQRKHCSSRRSWPFFGSTTPLPDPEKPERYINWLNRSGRLQAYLERSVAYIYLRDLGKTLDSPEEQENIRRTVDKIRTVSAQLPVGMEKDQAQRKLIKIIVGVLMHQMEALKASNAPEERAGKLDQAIRLGYAYGLTYPFIDDLLDSEVLSDQEKRQYAELIRSTLVTGTVPKLGEWQGSNRELIEYIHQELRDAYEYIKGHQPPEALQAFFDESYVFFNAQELDRNKSIGQSRIRK